MAEKGMRPTTYYHRGRGFMLAYYNMAASCTTSFTLEGGKSQIGVGYGA